MNSLVKYLLRFPVVVVVAALAASVCHADRPKGKAMGVQIWVSAEASSPERIAAEELARCLHRLYPETGFEMIRSQRPPLSPARHSARLVCLGTRQSAPELAEHVGRGACQGAESFVVTAPTIEGRQVGIVLGADPTGVLYGVYGLLESLGFGFYLSGDTLREPKSEGEPFTFDGWRLADRPLTADRIVFNWHNFLSGCSTWNLDDWKRWTVQSQKMRFNTIMVHAYGNNPMFTFTHNGVTKRTGFLTTTRRGRDWGTEHVNDVRRLPAGHVFDDAVFGADAAKGAADRHAESVQVLMKQVFDHAHERGLHVCFALDVDTGSANPQEIITTLPEPARFRVSVTGSPHAAGHDEMWLANPDTSEGYAYYKAQAATLLQLYPPIDRLVLWMRHGRSPWLMLTEAQLPEPWRKQYRAEIAKTPDAARFPDAPARFAVGKVLAAFQRAMKELGHDNVRLMMGSWRFDWLESCDRFFPADMAFLPLDYEVLRGRPELDDSDKRARLRRINKHREIIPIVWAHHDDGAYIGGSYVPPADFHGKLADAGSRGYGIIHWTTRPLDLYFESLSNQVWSTSKDEPLRDTCRKMAASIVGSPFRDTLGDYLYEWITTAPEFARETRDCFMDHAYSREDVEAIVAGCERRLRILENVDVSQLDAAAVEHLHYLEGMERFYIAFFRTEGHFQQSLELLNAGDYENARQAMARCDPEKAVAMYARASSHGGMTRGERGIVLSMGVRWIPFLENQRQALRMAPVRCNFGPTSHSELAQGPGTLTFHVGPSGRLWRTYGNHETGYSAYELPPAGKLELGDGMAPVYAEICRTGIQSDQPILLQLKPIVSGLSAIRAETKRTATGVLPGKYRVRLLFADTQSDGVGQRVFNVEISTLAATRETAAEQGRQGSHAKSIAAVDIFQRTRAANRVFELVVPVEIRGSGSAEVTIAPVRGNALICGAILEPVDG